MNTMPDRYPSLVQFAEQAIPLIDRMQEFQRAMDGNRGLYAAGQDLPHNNGFLMLQSFRRNELTKSSTILWNHESPEGFVSVSAFVSEAGIVNEGPGANFRVLRGNEELALFDNEITYGFNHAGFGGPKAYPATSFTWSSVEGRSKGQLTGMRIYLAPDTSLHFTLDRHTGESQVAKRGAPEATGVFPDSLAGVDAIAGIPFDQTIDFVEKAEEILRIARVNDFLEGVANVPTREQELREITTDLIKLDYEPFNATGRGIEKN